jgi:hypothetical protein
MEVCEVLGTPGDTNKRPRSSPGDEISPKKVRPRDTPESAHSTEENSDSESTISVRSIDFNLSIDESDNTKMAAPDKEKTLNYVYEELQNPSSGLILALRAAMAPLFEEQTKTVVSKQTLMLQKTLEEKEKRIIDLEEKVEKLMQDSDESQQYSRRNSVRFTGISEFTPTPNPDGSLPRENTDQLIKDIITKDMNLNFNDLELDRTHRIGKPVVGKTRAIIVKFTSYNSRRRVYQSRNLLRNIRGRGIYINEDLTHHRSRMLYLLRSMRKSHATEGGWSADGRVFAKGKDQVVHLIKNISDLKTFKASHTCIEPTADIDIDHTQNN